MDFAVIVPAAGSSTRFGGNKLIEPLAGKPLILHTLRAFTRRDDVTHIVVPTSNFADLSAALQASSPSILVDPRLNFCPGGACRAESVRRGLDELPASVEWVAIHDAARPLVSQDLIDSVVSAAAERNAAVVPALPMTLTVKRATGPLPARVERTESRDRLWTMQTPQVICAADLRDAYARCPLPLDQITDDVQLLELIGGEVWLVPGEERNLKVTTPHDLRAAELWT
jgi:2-C-methyl-D-erythritol 4-phosphate cytidylyltransferase